MTLIFILKNCLDYRGDCSMFRQILLELNFMKNELFRQNYIFVKVRVMRMVYNYCWVLEVVLFLVFIEENWKIGWSRR